MKNTHGYVRRLCAATLVPLLTLALMIQACTQAGPDRELELETIERMEAAARVMMNEEGRTDASLQQTAALRDAYLSFADNFPGDSLSAVFLFQAAMMDADLHDDVRGGIVFLERLAEEYPDHDLAARTLFLIGFTYAEQLNDYARAREAYARYLERYPNGEMAESIRIEMQSLGMRPRLGS